MPHSPDNVARFLAGEPTERAFERCINCPMEVGDGRALFVSGTSHERVR